MEDGESGGPGKVPELLDQIAEQVAGIHGVEGGGMGRGGGEGVLLARRQDLKQSKGKERKGRMRY